MTSPLLPYWLAATYLPHLKIWQFMQMLEHFASIKDLFVAPVTDLQAVGLNPVMIHALKNTNWQQVEIDLQWQNNVDKHLIAFDDECYPALLKTCADPPLLLFVHGDKKILSLPQFAIVGTRHPTPTGVRNAQHFAQALAEKGLVITSGLAMGIDGVSHAAALAARGKTIAVCGTGLNTIYPTKHIALAEQIIANEGALISEFSLNTPVRGYNFPRRNRIISGMSMGVLVVEATLNSGTLVTARLSLEQGRDVFAIPGNIHQPQYKGCHHLIKQGAILVETVTDIIMALPSALNLPVITAANTHSESKLSVSLSTKEQHVLRQIGYDMTPLDMIILRSGLTAGELSSILLSLEMAGIVQVVPGGYVREITNQ